MCIKCFPDSPDIDNVDMPRTSRPTINSGKIKQNENFVSSARNVALWVSTYANYFELCTSKLADSFIVNVKIGSHWFIQVSAAVAFGIGLGFKEGVDKASEFFTGYVVNLAFQSIS